jgi:prepilin-type N-terminal cleavage/methylation domain-containing protein
MRNLRNNKGFTLIELMIVVVIIGILAAIAIPKFTQVSNGAKQAEAGPILKQMCSLAEAEFLKTNTWTATEANLPGWEEPTVTRFAFTLAGQTATATPDAGQSLYTQAMDCDTKAVTDGALVP